MSLKGVLISVLLVWYLSETLFVAPYFLSYFNQFGGGAEGGYKYVTDSNYDWGQDFGRLVSWVDDHNVKKIAVDYFGAANIQYYLGSKGISWSSSKGNPKSEKIDWLAVSINTIEGAKGQIKSGLTRDPKDEYSWLKDPYKPWSKAGKSIFIYKINE